MQSAIFFLFNWLEDFCVFVNTDSPPGYPEARHKELSLTDDFVYLLFGG